MKWYWILLIVLGAIFVGMLISSAVKPKAKTTSTLTDTVTTKPAVVNTTVASGPKTDIVTTDNADGTKTTTVLTK